MFLPAEQLLPFWRRLKVLFRADKYRTSAHTYLVRLSPSFCFVLLGLQSRLANETNQKHNDETPARIRCWYSGDCLRDISVNESVEDNFYVGIEADINR